MSDTSDRLAIACTRILADKLDRMVRRSSDDIAVCIQGGYQYPATHLALVVDIGDVSDDQVHCVDIYVEALVAKFSQVVIKID